MNSASRNLVVASLGLAFVTSCSGEGPDEFDARTHAIDASASPTDSSKLAWKEWIVAEDQRIAAARPDFHATIMGLQGKPTRAGFSRLVDPALHDADAAPLLLVRLLEGGEETDTRAALAEALPRTQGSFSAAAAAMIADEADPKVQVVLVETMKRAEAPHAIAGLRAGLADADLEVRVAAARTAGTRAEGGELASELLAALDGDSVELRAAAARSLGLLGVDEAKAPLTAMLGDGGGELRLHALRALHRLDPAYAAGLPVVATLRDDPDPRVAKLAATILAAD